MNSCFSNIDWTAILTGVAAVAALLTAIATFRMVREMKTQREAAYRPYLSFEKAYFSVQAVDFGTFSYPKKWNETIVSDFYVEDPAKFETIKYNLKLFNIGFAAARNVEVKVSFDQVALIKQIKDLETKIPSTSKVKIEETNVLLAISPSAIFEKGAFAFGKDIGKNTDFTAILPISINKEFYPVDIPLAFIELVNVYMYYAGLLLGTKEKMEPSIPILNIHIEYKNIFNVQKTQRFTIASEIYSFGGGSFTGKFQIHEIIQN